ncbi:MAG: hypothetical protein IPP27_05410 [Bacteroidetes bacterium]|nr:hypothetical protein [Bacteroidota bacterium]MBK9412450.1 hypothetical protein [Bacteroidota bacterium]MBL0031634.1 hypothetical protein [Bacteroidota bacterium]
MSSIKYVILFVGVLVLYSCRKENEVPVVNGNVVLNVHAVHHSWDVSNVKIYLEANTLVFPGRDSTVYDKSLTTDGSGRVSFTQLFPGNYYIYASGFDSTWGANVIGYKLIYLTEENLINNEMSVTLNVSE